MVGLVVVGVRRRALQEGRGHLGVRALRDVLDAQLTGEPRHGLGAGQLLEAPAVGPGDLTDQRGPRHREEADLARAAGPAPVQPAAEDQGGAEALLVPQEDEVGVVAGRAEPLFREGDQVDVVLVLERHRQRGGQFVEQRGECQPGRCEA
ncbi:hypothetical protein SHKM778_79750 [Streptomyces sp. KM77-8]|uniref:Uncharacterized protein n=1 Tax=Streptomyces haneummycinicus TaxID=3074435 RepID=A0AAT9HX73_9ACTN